MTAPGQPPTRPDDARAPDDRFRFAPSDLDPTGLDILDPDGARVAWGRGEYAVVALRAINDFIDGDAEQRAERAEAWARAWATTARRYRRMLAVHRDRARGAADGREGEGE